MDNVFHLSQVHSELRLRLRLPDTNISQLKIKIDPAIASQWIISYTFSQLDTLIVKFYIHLKFIFFPTYQLYLAIPNITQRDLFIIPSYPSRVETVMLYDMLHDV